jgi:hypothetical protein
MRDIRDLLSGSPHIERIVFACEKTHVRHEPTFQEEKRTHYYIGATSNDRFLLIEIPSPKAASQPVDLLKLAHPVAMSRTSDTDFYYNGPLISPQPRASSPSNLGNALRMRLHPLRECLQLGIMEIKPGSVRWEGDRFTAEYSDAMKKPEGKFSMHFGRPGEVVPESVKEKYLADLQNPPADRPKLVCRSERHFEMGKPREIPEPAPGSVEARIMAHYAAKHEARMAKGINGQLRRDAQGNVTEIRFDAAIPYHIELEYAPTADLPLPFPHRIKKIFDPTRFAEEVPSSQMTIYSARISDQPVDAAAFVLWNYLKEGTYVHGIALPNGRFTLADPKDHTLWRELRELADRRARLDRP